MTGAPIIELRGVEKALGESFPLRIKDFTLRENERAVLAGLPGVMGEALMNMIIGATLPDEGDIIVFGTNTRDIRTDTEWLTSLDRFGLVSNRAVLLDQSTIAQNLALPMTLAIDPMAPDVRATVEALALEVGLLPESVDRPPTPTGENPKLLGERVRLHLARALANRPQVLLLEHPTQGLDVGGYQLGATIRSIADARKLSFLAVTDDDLFARETGGRRLVVERDGSVVAAGLGLRNLFGRLWGG